MSISMEQYILPLFCLLLNFGAMSACLRFFLSREGGYWLLPLLLSLLLFLRNGSGIYHGFSTTDIPITTGSLVDLLVSILWYAIIIIFRYALKSRIQQSNYRKRVQKDLTESQFILKTEQVETQRRLRRMRVLAQGSARRFAWGNYKAEWTDLFDQF